MKSPSLIIILNVMTQVFFFFLVRKRQCFKIAKQLHQEQNTSC